MTRRCLVMRKPRWAKICCSLPVVSAVLRRSPVETRRDGVAAMLSPPENGTADLRSAGEAFVSGHCTQTLRITAKMRNDVLVQFPTTRSINAIYQALALQERLPYTNTGSFAILTLPLL